MNFPVDLSEAWLQKARDLNLRVEDISEKMVTGGGKGGQKINKTASCVMLKHQPTAVTVRCQKHREQSKNRLSAYKLLILKVEHLLKGEQSEIAKKIHKLRKQKQRRSARAKEKVLGEKIKRGEIKKLRASVAPE